MRRLEFIIVIINNSTEDHLEELMHSVLFYNQVNAKVFTFFEAFSKFAR